MNKKYKCINAGCYSTLTEGKIYECLMEYKIWDEIQIRNDSGRKQDYMTKYFVEVKEKVSDAPSDATLSAIEKRVKTAREELQKLEADLKKAQEKPTKNLVERGVIAGKKCNIIKACEELALALGLNINAIDIRRTGAHENKALYISDFIDAKLVVDGSGKKCLILQEK